MSVPWRLSNPQYPWFITREEQCGRLCPYNRPSSCRYQFTPARPRLRVSKDHQIYDQVISLLLQIIPYISINQSAVASHFADTLESFKPNHEFATVVPHLQTREITTLWSLCLYMWWLTETGMLIEEVTQYRDPSIRTRYTFILARHIYIQAILYTLNFIRPRETFCELSTISWYRNCIKSSITLPNPTFGLKSMIIRDSFESFRRGS